MSRDRSASERSIIDGLMEDDPDTIAWLVRLGLVEIGSDGRWHATALASAAMARSRQQLVENEPVLPPRSSMH
jgi:hypothetical protein